LRKEAIDLKSQLEGIKKTTSENTSKRDQFELEQEEKIKILTSDTTQNVETIKTLVGLKDELSIELSKMTGAYAIKNAQHGKLTEAGKVQTQRLILLKTELKGMRTSTEESDANVLKDISRLEQNTTTMNVDLSDINQLNSVCTLK
jgi:hypothetical protein